MMLQRIEAPAEIVTLRELEKWSYARNNFWLFRQAIHPELITGDWPRGISRHLQKFYKALIAGKRPKLVISSPPQHGKSTAITDFIAWVMGLNPDLKVIFASYSDALGERTSIDLQRILNSDIYIKIFGRTRIGLPGWKMTSDFFELADYCGSFRYTTALGAVTGLELHLGVIDDVVKGRQEAFSKTVRDRTWAWFTDDFRTRFNKDAGLLAIGTRWHVDDMLGRLINKYPDAKVLRYQAIADDTNEALFPEWKPLDFLLDQKRAMTTASWEALYQQRPIITGGGELPIEKLQTVSVWNTHDTSKVSASCRYWDCASSQAKDASWTAGVLMHRTKDGNYVISHVAHGQWPANEREQLIRQTAEADKKIYKNLEIGIEQEPGSAGLDRVQMTIRNLAGFRAFADKVTGSKEVRAQPFAAQVPAGNVALVAGAWNEAYLEEAEIWPQGREDQIDASSGAFNRLVKATTFNTNFKDWV
jgi:predicted phage terminase large subunit-like protein